MKYSKDWHDDKGFSSTVRKPSSKNLQILIIENFCYGTGSVRVPRTVWYFNEDSSNLTVIIEDIQLCRRSILHTSSITLWILCLQVMISNWNRKIWILFCEGIKPSLFREVMKTVGNEKLKNVSIKMSSNIIRRFSTYVFDFSGASVGSTQMSEAAIWKNILRVIRFYSNGSN